MILAVAFLAALACSPAATAPRRHVAQSRVVLDMNRAQAWRHLEQFGQAHRYVPGVSATQITTDAKRGEGASRHIEQSLGGMDETVMNWNEGRGYTLRLHNGDANPLIFKEAQFLYRLSDHPGGQSEMICQLSYTLDGGPALEFLHQVALGSAIQSTNDNVAKSLKQYYESTPPAADKETTP
jgi:hypothetical protein